MSEHEYEAKMAHPRMAAGALLFDDSGRALLVEPSYKDYRDVPGGYVERGSPHCKPACARSSSAVSLRAPE